MYVPTNVVVYDCTGSAILCLTECRCNVDGLQSDDSLSLITDFMSASIKFSLMLQYNTDIL